MIGHRVLLVRPWDTARTGGSGCCTGATGGICVEGWHDDPEAARDRAGREPLGEVYRTVRAGLPAGIEIEIVDPHNTLFLLPAMARDARRRGLGWWGTLREVVRGPGYAAIIVDGQVVSHGELPPPDRALRLIRAALESHRLSSG
jgi:hypothetical protein